MSGITTAQANIAREEADNAVLWFTRDGIIGRLQRMAPSVDRWRTRVTRGAYGRGFDRGVRAIGSGSDNPYREHAGNFYRGGNDARQAWQDGWTDGQRARLIVTMPEFVGDLAHREYKLLPSKLRERVDARRSDVEGAAS